MNPLIAKLTNLSYEFFGIFLPGLVCWTLVGLWWATLGPVASYWTAGWVPHLTVTAMRRALEATTTTLAVAGSLPAIMSVYFFGHVVHWLARSGKPIGEAKGSLVRTRRSLVFRIPKPNDPYDPRLKPLLELVQKQFAGGHELEWGQLFPVLRTFLSRNLSFSLVAIYQNKYTLHRAITASAAAWFWLNLLTIPAALLTRYLGGPSLHWVPLFLCILCALVLVWGFSDSYMYHWKNFGNAIVTETYSILAGPHDDEKPTP